MQFARSPRTRSPVTWRSWALCGVILLAAAVALLLLQAGLLPARRPLRQMMLVAAGVNLAYFAWLFLAGLSPLGRALVAVVFVGLQAALFGAVRLDGVAGDGRPIWAWRWIPTPDERLQHRLAATEEAALGASVEPAPVVELQSQADSASPGDVLAGKMLRWPGFRGSDRSGRAANIGLATDWQQHPPRLLWRQPIGLGWSSFAVWDELCITQEQRGEMEAVVAYELATGRQRWVHSDRVRFEEFTAGVGPRATPAIAEGRVVALGATGILNCLDLATGRKHWSVQILDQHAIENRLFGMCGSPLVVESAVIVAPGAKGASLAAYDLQTGDLFWKGGDAASSYSSPQLAPFLTGSQVLNFNAAGIYAHDLQDGRVLWQLEWVSNPAERNNVCQPVALPGVDGAADRVFVSSGYGQGSALLQLAQVAGRHAVRTLWSNRSLQAKFSSVVIQDGHVYGFDGAILCCLELATGKRKWKAGRYGYGQLIVAGNLLVVQLESGPVALVAADPAAHRELARVAALEDRTWNHPVLVGRYLLVRNDRDAACFELPLDRR